MSDSHKATTINHFYEKLLRIKVCVYSPSSTVCVCSGVCCSAGALAPIQQHLQLNL